MKKKVSVVFFFLVLLLFLREALHVRQHRACVCVNESEKFHSQPHYTVSAGEKNKKMPNPLTQTSKKRPSLLESVTPAHTEASSPVSASIPNEVRRLQTGL